MSFFPEKKSAYYGKPASHFDHLYPLIVNRKPTGYGTEPANLVPCCRECNQPKGNNNWEDFMRSEKCKHVCDVSTDEPHEAMEHRISVIKEFQKSMPPHIIKLDEDTLKEWNDILSSYDNMLKETQEKLLALREKLYNNN